MFSRICIVQIQPRKVVLDNNAHFAYCRAPTRQQDDPDRTDQEPICPERSRSSSGSGGAIRVVKYFDGLAITCESGYQQLHRSSKFTNTIRTISEIENKKSPTYHAACTGY